MPMEGELRGVIRVVIRGPIFVTPSALEYLRAQAEVRPPTCHAEIDGGPDGLILNCEGSCPPNENCLLKVELQGSSLRIYCECG
jgi:hypothetical protein